MASYSLNDDAVVKALALIDSRQYVIDSNWGESQPSPDDENDYLEDHTWAEYGAWHLGLTDGANDETKARHAFVFGDLRRVHRMGLIACRFRPRSGAARRSSSPPTTSCNTSTTRSVDEAFRQGS